MRRMSHLTSLSLVVLVISRLLTIIGHQRPWTALLPPSLLAHDLSTRLRLDPLATTMASTDFGMLVATSPPAAVLKPSSTDDIAALIMASYSSHLPFPISARGHGHSIHGQAFAPDGVVINMRSLSSHTACGGTKNENRRINVSAATSSSPYVDVGGEQLWIEVLKSTLEHGLAPRSWTDYLHLTVGGTLSNGGISGQAFRYGPQISNVYEMDVITGKGEVVTCSKERNSELFHAVLGGLGQFGVITRARVALERAPQRVKWVRLMYEDFSTFSEDQEQLIAPDGFGMKGFDYVEGSLISDSSILNNWRSSFFSGDDHGRIRSLATRHPLIYCLEAAKYYDHTSANVIDQEVGQLLERLNFVPGFVFINDVSYADFLDRVHTGEQKLREEGLWDVPHPWLNLLVPRSRIHDFHAGVFQGVLRHNLSLGPILVYPINRNKWDDEMSMVVPDEEVFYSIGLLRSAPDGWEYLEEQNREILRFCRSTGIGIKQYLPYYRTRAEWEQHFGPKWHKFLMRKMEFDPKGILSPGQMIFSSPFNDTKK